MNKITKILVATDLGPAGDQAIETAHAWATRLSASLVIAHVIGARTRIDPLFPQQHQGRALEGLELSRVVSEKLDDRVRTLTGRAAGSYELRVVDGSAAEQILDLAQQTHADLIVLGGRTAGGTRWVFGSVAERVVTHADIPVLVARAEHGAGHILAATDLSEPSLPAVTAAHDLARVLSAKVTIVHCVEPDTSTYAAISTLTSGPTEGGDPEEISEARRRLREICKASPEHDDSRVLVGDPAESIVALAETLPASLVVVASRGRSGLARLMLGSVAGRVVRHAPCSVLVVRLRG